MNKAFIITNFFDAFSRTAVPVFILVSGYFSLNHLVTAQKYIKKIIVKFIIPTIIWIVFYHIFFKVRIEKGVSFKELLDLDYLKGISEVFFSNQGSYLWFMPMFIGLQILTPLLILLRDKLIGQRGFLLLGVAMLLAGMFFVVFRLVVKPIIIQTLRQVSFA
ncbi:acyltransferase family protein [Listeria innocua]|nr:acyltransferase family protein [Listeria innocua]MBC1904787.1 acyltransferase family protein [Listeria innocua]MBC2137623.1 acyltransferase family protein [Listeria innocua]